ncbi:class I SAM-dependent methyltransferase [Pseudorhodobacter sp.]|uniref:class I SAM-dependent DNA methyltransferase n=1 Tax=Pseudorhodobacter sp. TaxID=1934400 RepID=UPI0026473FB4|nr:class I SAM-dependent methyltransferase [Pseudorhodobacter sp.]MDN5786214.1 class I SAM-dependent methyltransferase [Pseudorhodobacter sp.]
MTQNNPDLDKAYALHTPDDNRALYADWAESYDADFAARMAYRLPALVAAAYRGGGPVLDVGAGTGLLGQALAARGVGPVDGLDISPQMLAKARAKGVYRDLMLADVTTALELPFAAYRGVVSSGTFTHGHVGPAAIRALLAVAAPGAQFALSVNKVVYAAEGFAAMLSELAGRIDDVEIDEEPIYADAPDPAHRSDMALIVRFTRI